MFELIKKYFNNEKTIVDRIIKEIPIIEKISTDDRYTYKGKVIFGKYVGKFFIQNQGYDCENGKNNVFLIDGNKELRIYNYNVFWLDPMYEDKFIKENYLSGVWDQEFLNILINLKLQIEQENREKENLKEHEKNMLINHFNNLFKKEV